MNDEQPVHLLIAFDGSDNSHRAIAEAARLFPHARATIAYAWQPEPVGASAGYSSGAVVLPLEIDEEVTEEALAAAGELAALGEDTAREQGLVAASTALPAAGPVWKALIDLAESIDADVVVAGSRGRGGIKSMLLGSTSSALAHHGTRPLLVIPPA